MHVCMYVRMHVSMYVFIVIAHLLKSEPKKS